MFQLFKKNPLIQHLIILTCISGAFFFSIDRTLAAGPVQLRSLKSQNIEITGQFGKDCKKCEIIVDYGKGFLYAYRPDRWNEKKLLFTLKDFGKSLKVKIFVRTASGDSQSRTFNIKPLLTPPKLSNKIQQIKKINKHLIFSASHADAFGGKGLDQFNVGSTKPKCNNTVDIYHQARMVIDKKRFGDARLESKPPTACVKCTPLKVRWYHEPTGSIHYQLHIQKRQIQGICPAQIRRN